MKNNKNRLIYEKYFRAGISVPENLATEKLFGKENFKRSVVKLGSGTQWVVALFLNRILLQSNRPVLEWDIFIDFTRLYLFNLFTKLFVRFFIWFAK